MVVLLVVAGLLMPLALACVREARSGRPSWDGPRSVRTTPTTRDAARAAKAGLATTLALGAFLGGADGSSGG